MNVITTTTIIASSYISGVYKLPSFELGPFSGLLIFSGTGSTRAFFCWALFTAAFVYAWSCTGGAFLQTIYKERKIFTHTETGQYPQILVLPS